MLLAEREIASKYRPARVSKLFRQSQQEGRIAVSTSSVGEHEPVPCGFSGTMEETANGGSICVVKKRLNVGGHVSYLYASVSLCLRGESQANEKIDK